MRRQISKLLIGLTLAVSIGVVAAPTAFALPTPPCAGSGCNGVNVGQCGESVWFGDDNLNPVWSSDMVGDSPTFGISGSAYILLYYSPWCNSNWAAIGGGDGSTSIDWVRVQNSYGATGWGSWGQMVDGSVSAQACVGFTVTGDPNEYVVCTNWH
jgi:hypothetical protein